MKNNAAVLVTLFVAPAVVQLVYTIPLFEPRVSADAVLQFTGVLLGLVFAASIAYRNAKAHRLAEREAAVGTLCLDLLHDLQVNSSSFQLTSKTRQRVIRIKMELKAIDSDVAEHLRAVMRPICQRLLNQQVAYQQSLADAELESFASTPISGPDGEEGEAFLYRNPEEEFEARKKALESKFSISPYELNALINTALKEMGETF